MSSTTGIPNTDTSSLLGHPILEGWMLKKKRKKMQGFARRYFYLSQQPAVLSYSFSPNTRIRDSVFITLASISISRKSRSIHLDSGGSLVMHIKTTSDVDFLRWTAALQSVCTGSLKERQRRRLQQRKDASQEIPKKSELYSSQGGSSVRPVEMSNLYHSVARMQAPLTSLEAIQEDLRELLTIESYPQPICYEPRPSSSPPPTNNPYAGGHHGSSPKLPTTTPSKGKKPRLFKNYSSNHVTSSVDPNRILKALSDALDQLKAEHLNLVDLINVHRNSMVRDRSLGTTDLPPRPNSSLAMTARHPPRISTTVMSSSTTSSAYLTPTGPNSSRRSRSGTLTKPDVPQASSPISLVSDGASEGDNDSGSDLVFHDAAEEDVVFVDLDALNEGQDTEAELVGGLDLHSSSGSGYDTDSDSSSEDDEEQSEERPNQVAITPQSSSLTPKTKTELEAPRCLLSFVKRRTCLPAPMSGDEFSLFSLLKKNMGKDLSQVSFPISFNEPLSVLQKMCEDCEYVDELLDRATKVQNPLERLVYVAAFVVSGFFSTKTRAFRKPFNPMLGETFECVRLDKGLKYLAEKVVHHPPLMASYAEGDGWTLETNSSARQKFWGQSLEIIPEGFNRLTIFNKNVPQQGRDVYSWDKPSSFVRNLVSGSKYLEHIGKVAIENLNGSERAVVEFKPGTTFGGEASRNKVETKIYDENGRVAITLVGKWDSHLVRTDLDEVVFEAHPLPENAIEYYGFTRFAIELNEITEDLVGRLPDSDSRLRPDQRLFEEGNIDEADEIKKELEEKQRIRRREGNHIPSWFQQVGKEWVYKGGYFEMRQMEEPMWKPLKLF